MPPRTRRRGGNLAVDAATFVGKKVAKHVGTKMLPVVAQMISRKLPPKYSPYVHGIAEAGVHLINALGIRRRRGRRVRVLRRR